MATKELSPELLRSPETSVAKTKELTTVCEEDTVQSGWSESEIMR